MAAGKCQGLGDFFRPVSHFSCALRSPRFSLAKAYISIGFHTFSTISEEFPLVFFAKILSIFSHSSMTYRHHFRRLSDSDVVQESPFMQRRWQSQVFLGSWGTPGAASEKRRAVFMCVWRKDPSKHPPKMSLSSTYTFIIVYINKYIYYIHVYIDDGSYLIVRHQEGQGLRSRYYERIRFEVPQNSGNRSATTTPTQPFDSDRSPEKDHHPTKHSLGGTTFKRSPIFYLIHRKSTANQRDVCLCACQKTKPPPKFRRT